VQEGGRAVQGDFTTQQPLPEFPLWGKLKAGRNLISFDLEITARCNNNCRHCYINLPANDSEAEKAEISFEQIKNIIDQAHEMGALWCLLTGGEPLLRKDFFEIYMYLKRKGLLISVFTNATTITDKHIELFKKFPPRDIEVTVYGITKDTYERISRKAGSFDAFMKGLSMLIEAGVRVRFKAMALRSNVHELEEIAKFCRERTKDYFRFDPFLHLRFDGDKKRNEEIKAERLSADDIVRIERQDPERSVALEKNCDKMLFPEAKHLRCNHLFHCGTGEGSFTVSYDGLYRLCSSLWSKESLYDLKTGTLRQAWDEFVPRVRDLRSNKKQFLERCRRCPIINLCIWCPAHAHLETGEMDEPVEYFCEVAHARENAFSTKAADNG
jgi:radical SAM protein with 4Fe4S-binding SPASM domain